MRKKGQKSIELDFTFPGEEKKTFFRKAEEEIMSINEFRIFHYLWYLLSELIGGFLGGFLFDGYVSVLSIVLGCIIPTWLWYSTVKKISVGKGELLDKISFYKGAISNDMKKVCFTSYDLVDLDIFLDYFQKDNPKKGRMPFEEICKLLAAILTVGTIIYSCIPKNFYMTYFEKALSIWAVVFLLCTYISIRLLNVYPKRLVIRTKAYKTMQGFYDLVKEEKIRRLSSEEF